MQSGLQPSQLRGLFDRASQRALAAAANRLDNEFTTQLTTVKWPWASKGGAQITYRKNKTEAKEPRNIVDLGNLRKSQSRRQAGKYKYEWIWDVDYSAIVHDGGVLKDGRTKYPDRPWTKSAEEEVKPLEYFTDILERELNG